jgi:hypothetical protein
MRGGIGRALGSGPVTPGLIFAAGLFAFYGAWVALWLGDGALYAAALRLYGIDPVIVRGYTMPLPFFDLEGVLSWSECARRGIDVFLTNPCDPIGRPSNYSPLLAHPALGGVGIATTIPLGLAVDAIFLALVPFVLRPRCWREIVIGWLAACSPAVLYALERCNIDVIVFAVLALVILLASPGWRQRLTYAAGFLLGFIKFYPFCLLALSVRERWRWFVVLGSGAAAAMAVFLLLHRHAFAVIAFPGPDWFGDTFSARQLADGIRDLAAIKTPYLNLVLVLPAGLALAAAWRISTACGAMLPPAAWQERTYLLLLFGALMIVSCFALQSNMYYRALFLLPVLVGLWQLCDRAGPSLRRLFGWAIAGLVACLWAEMARTSLVLLAAQFPPGGGRLAAAMAIRIVTLGLREALWWGEISILAGLVLCFLRGAPAVRDLAGFLGLKYGVSGSGPVVVLAASHDPDRQT